MKIRFGIVHSLESLEYIRIVERDLNQGLFFSNVLYKDGLYHFFTSSAIESRKYNMALNLKRFIKVGYSSNILEERFKV